MLTSFLVALVAGLILAVLVQAQAQSGFISIDCGAPANSNYTEPNTGINFISDANFIDTGVSKSITPELKSNYPRPTWNVRSFPEGKRSCYKINTKRGSTYLIGAGFLYGNYDDKNELPQFDVYFGPNYWNMVVISNASQNYYGEIIHKPSLDYIQICLVDTGSGTPFISYIEIRTLPNDTYVPEFGSLEYYYRCDLGSTSEYGYRYPDDAFDRYWDPHKQDNWAQLNASIPADSNINEDNDYTLPAIVMSTAVTPANASAPLEISWKPERETDQFYVYMHFMEIRVLAKNQTREFNIIQNGELWFENVAPAHLATYTVYSTGATSGKEIKYSLEKTKNSTLPPIINAMEVYRLIDFQQLETFQGDVDAIATIKSVYEVKRNWQGDPCNPKAYLWDGLNCTYNGNDSPRITTLNLSSSGLTGSINFSISSLNMLEKLDLSNNNLNGQVPDFLSQLQHLKFLSLKNNNLTGPVPSQLVDKFNEGSLMLIVDQRKNSSCESGQCNEKTKKNIIAPLVASVSGLLIFLVAVGAMFWILKRRKAKTAEKDPNDISPGYENQNDSSLQVKKQIYSYSDVLTITNNFNTILGKGGFGIVYLGYINDIAVAVKMLSPLSVRGYQQFQVEVKLLMRVHHKNLTSLIGYCNEETNKGLIYEYMSNGIDNNKKILTWENRLQIAVDVASGLEYLQNGCRPSIIHRDVKSTNILLNENLQAKLSDFGLSKSITIEGGSHVSTVVAGTLGYLDPDYFITNRLTEKSDVYSFGVVLLEIITCQPVIARNQEKTRISQWVSSLVEKGDIKAIVDSRLGEDFDINSAWKAVEIAMACVTTNPNIRPTMSMIVSELKECLSTKLTRTKYGGANKGDSIELWDMNMSSDPTPLAR